MQVSCDSLVTFSASSNLILLKHIEIILIQYSFVYMEAILDFGSSLMVYRKSLSFDFHKCKYICTTSHFSSKSSCTLHSKVWTRLLLLDWILFYRFFSIYIKFLLFFFFFFCWVSAEDRNPKQEVTKEPGYLATRPLANFCTCYSASRCDCVIKFSLFVLFQHISKLGVCFSFQFLFLFLFLFLFGSHT